ncbi:phage holin family protein [Tissierella sp. MSJ-40]|uniref:Phage holin family protein n=1 Tax=Tissierella simiarum TaxID=2841534 RepID=A0ABS6EB52_9FIRM|nr:phage holin family protein [Tissierella simiarum]MBU5440159.1 phage holin family protein [Tissierella simiarum]
MNHKTIFNGIIATVGTGLTYLIGGWNTSLKILAIFIIMDYLTGIMNGFINKKLSSSVGFNGLLRKAAIFFVIIIANQLDIAVSNDNSLFRTMACYFYIANEGISITENIALLGIPLPEFIVKTLNKLKEESDDIKE